MALPVVHLVASARPNLPKLASVWRALDGEEGAGVCAPRILHTGQHHDDQLFSVHLEDLGLPAPHIALGISGGTHAQLTGRTMIACEAAWQKERPALAIVVGDVDGTLAAAVAARKLRIPIAHLEAGLRGGDWNMAEEVNRRAVDAISDLLWAASIEDAEGLLAAQHDPKCVRAVGNTMADTLLHLLPRARERPIPGGFKPGSYGLVTMHRAENVDTPERLAAWLGAIGDVARMLPLAWPVHPRAQIRMKTFGFIPPPGVRSLPPLGYLDFAALMAGARFLATDSGGVQEEATVLDIPCLTMRETTERPLTLHAGSSRLVEPKGLLSAAEDALSGRWVHARPVPLWDTEVGGRIRAHLAERFG